MVAFRSFQRTFLILLLVILTMCGIYYKYLNTWMQELLEPVRKEEVKIYPGLTVDTKPAAPFHTENVNLFPGLSINNNGQTQSDSSRSDDDCRISTPIKISFTEILQDAPCEARFCSTTEGNQRKIASYNFSKAEPYLVGPESKSDREIIYKGPGTSGVEIPAFVGGASSNHFHEALKLLRHFNSLIRPAYPNLKLHYFDLGLQKVQHEELEKLCNCTVLTFPFEKYPAHVRQLFGYSWKPIVVKIMLETYRFVVWMDTSIVFRTAELDDLFTKAREQGVMARHDHHSLAAHTNEETFLFLQEPPCLFRNFSEFITGLTIFHSDNKLIYDYIFQPWLKCALIEDCMKTKHQTGGRLLYCKSHKVYHSCHRYDQTILSILLYRLFPTSYMDHHIDDKFWIPT